MNGYQRLDRFIMKWMGFTFDGKKGAFRKLTIEELVAGLEENTAIAIQLLEEDAGEKMAEKVWGSGRFNLLMHYLKGQIPAEVFDEIEREYHRDTVDFVTALDK